MTRRQLPATLALALALALNIPARADPKNTPMVELNAASQAQLERLPGIGAKRAQAILRYRQRRAFRRPADLLRVKGIGRRIYARIKPFVYVAEAGPGLGKPPL